MSSIPALDRGLTGPLDPLLGARFERLRQAIDDRAGVRVDDDGIEVRRLLKRHRVAWDDVASIDLDSRLESVLAVATWLVPLRRVPYLGRAAAGLVASGSGTLGRLLPAQVRDVAGWSVATIHRHSTLRRSVDVDGGARLVALMQPAVTHTVTSHARMRHIEVSR